MSVVARSDGPDLYFEVSGRFEDLGCYYLIRGSGATLEDRIGLITGMLASRFQVLAYDYRGLGAATRDRGYTMADCATDAVAAMDAAGWSSAPVVGLSWWDGGPYRCWPSPTPNAVERLSPALYLGRGAAVFLPFGGLDELDPAARQARHRTLLDTRCEPDWLDSTSRRLTSGGRGRARGSDREPGRRGHVRSV